MPAIMSMYLTHSSLYDFYCSAASSTPTPGAPLAAIEPGHIPSISEADMAFLSRMYDIDKPFDVAVLTQAQRKKNSCFRSMIHDGHLPTQLYFGIGHEVFAAVPEACMLQLAQKLDPTELLMAYYEILGSYWLHDGGEFGYTPRRPLTTYESAMEFCKNIESAPGKRAMLRALECMAKGSAASPPEAQMACFFTAPKRIGGAGFSGAELNFPIKTAVTTRYGDLCWPDHKLVLEYESNQDHTGAEKINKDSMRRAEIMAVGWTVITVTSQQLNSLTAMNRLIPVVVSYLGKAFRPRSKDYLAKQGALYRTIMSPMTHREVSSMLGRGRLRLCGKKPVDVEPKRELSPESEPECESISNPDCNSKAK